MGISKAQIYNITLNILGVSTPIENAESSDNRAILLNNYYDLAKEYVLKDFDWNFASVYRELTLCQNYNNTYCYDFCYDYPNNCICARDIFEKGTQKSGMYKIGSIENGEKAIFTNVKNAVLRYTRRIDREIFFSCEFSMALSFYLASLTSGVITGSVQKGENAYEKYRTLLKRAKVLNAQEGADFLYDDNTYLESRG